MKKLIERAKRRSKVKRRIRSQISGTAERPRVSVFRSNKHFYAQVIDDVQAITLASVASGQNDFKGEVGNRSCAKKCGEKMGLLLKDKKVKTVVFDRNGFIYHGIVKEFADALRDQGIIL